MFRKTVLKVMALRRGESEPEVDQKKSNRDYGDEMLIGEPEASRMFRHAFIDKLEMFRREAQLLASGNAEFNDTWKDTMGKEGLALAVVIVGGVIGILGALMILSAAVSAGIAIPVAVVGLIAGVAFYKYREHVKDQRYKSAEAIMDRDDLSKCIRQIAQQLADLYRVQLANCTIKDAHNLAANCVKAISEDMLKNKDFDFNELMSVSSLQGVLMRSLKAMPKTKLDMNIISKRKFNTRGMVSHSAYYCRDTGEFYQTSFSKSTKYGVLFFDKKADLKDYESILTSTMKGGEKWKLSKMRPHEVKKLQGSSMFRTYQNDKLFEGRKVMEEVDHGERMKVT